MKKFKILSALGILSSSILIGGCVSLSTSCSCGGSGGIIPPVPPQPTQDSFILETTEWHVQVIGEQQYVTTCNTTWNGDNEITMGRKADNDPNYILCSDLIVTSGLGPTYKDIGLPQSQKPTFLSKQSKTFKLTFAYRVPSTPFSATFNMTFHWITSIGTTKEQNYGINLYWNC